MKYDNITKRENKLNLERDLCKLYVACDCLEEFLIKANLRYGKIPWRLLTAFKLFYVKKSKPLLYYGIKFCYYILFLICLLPFIMLCFPLILLIPVFELIYTYMFYDNMKTIKWYDNGCPIEY